MSQKLGHEMTPHTLVSRFYSLTVNICDTRAETTIEQLLIVVRLYS